MISTPINKAVALGNIPGFSPLNKFARNIDIDSAATADIWDGGHTGDESLVWVAPTQARIHTIASTSSDDDVGGIGASTVKVYYLADWDSKEAYEIVTGDLNAGVAMVNAAVIINRMVVIPQSTSTSINVGVIAATAAVDGTVTAQIRAVQGQTQSSIYGIPSTQTMYMGRLYANTNKAGGGSGLIDISMCVNPAPNIQLPAFLIKHTFGLSTAGTTALSILFDIPKTIPGPAIIKMNGVSGAANMDVSAGYDAIIKDN